MAEALDYYRNLQDKLSWIRWSHMGHESDEEDAHLEKMDEAWWELSDAERNKISAEPSRQDPVEPTSLAGQFIDVNIAEHPGPVRTVAA